MIAALIRWCMANRAMVLLLTACLVAAGAWSAAHITVDAVPDLSDVQVVIRTEYPGQAPQIVEDQVTYPLTTAMLAVPYAKTVRGQSMFGTSFVYIIFEDGTDIYWARSRVLEQLSVVRGQLPEGVSPQLGPDATAVGWVFQYVLVTGRYCPEHPDGDVHQRVFTNGETTCPVTGEPLVDAQVDLAELRGLQDWYLRYELVAVDGVSEVAPVGGFVKQYQVVVDPVNLLARGVTLQQVKSAINKSNRDAGGRLVELSETEYMVRGLGYLGGDQTETESRAQAVMDDLDNIALGATPDGSPIYLADVAQVRVGPDIRRGIVDWNGRGEAVGGIIVMRFAENAQATIERVQARLEELERGLPPGVGIEIAYDRSDLIERAIDTVRETLLEEVIVVSLVIVLFLLHARSAMVAAFVLPTGVLATLTIMHVMGLNANIMSLGGIAISIGVMVDSSIVMVENAHKHLEWQRRRVAEGGLARPRALVIADAAAEVGPTLFFSLLIITVSFLPIFVLSEQSGRLFRPLAYTKTFAMASAAVLAVTIIPVLMSQFITERVLPEAWSAGRRWVTYGLVIVLPAVVLVFAPLPRLEAHRWWMVGAWVVLSALAIAPQRFQTEQRNPINRLLQRVYDPAFVFVMHYRWPVLIAAVLLVVLTVLPLRRLGGEFMPPLEEGDLLYMPQTDPGISSTKVRELLQQTDKLLASFPEVDKVFGKAGRAETATDPAPLNMLETTITLHRDKARWRTRQVERFYSGWPNIIAWLPRMIFPDERPITVDELVKGYDVIDGTHVPGLNETLQIPGLTNAWTMPIRTRIDMLSTGIRTPVGVKIMGPDLTTLAELAEKVSTLLTTDRATAAYTTSAFPDKTVGGNYLDFKIDRDKIARYGLSISDVQDVIASAMGGMSVTSTVEGLERYPVNVRYPRELRDDVDALRTTLVATPGGAQVPIGQLADIVIHKGPQMLRSENARLASYVFVDIAGIDIGTYVREAQRLVSERVELPPGYSIAWSGQFEYMQAARARLMVVVPMTLVIILLFIYLSTRSWWQTVVVMLTVVLFAPVGSVWLLYALGYNLSLAVGVGMIALAGLAVETGLVMLMYLDNSFEQWKADGRMRNADDLWHAVRTGAVLRVRPITMTTLTTFIGLAPLLWAQGAGADTMRRLAAPMIGGLATAYLSTLLLYPIIFYIVKRLAMRRGASPSN